ncbi:MAG: AMP-binding protein [Solirubrobacterales bacterium]
MSTGTIADDLRQRAGSDPQATAVVAAGREVAYGELDRMAGGVAGGLHEHGVHRGDRVVMVLPNGLEAVAAIEGTLRSGAALCPLNPSIKRDRLARVLRSVEPTVVLCDAERAEVAESAAELAGGILVDAEVAALAEGPEREPVRSLDSDLAAILHTSGSTGGPKGVMHTHRNLTFATDSINEYLKITPADRILCLLQLSFGYGLSQLLCCMRAGATLVLEEGFAFPGRVVELLTEQRITGLPGVPTIFTVLLSLRGLADRDLPDLRFITNAGAALPGPTQAALRSTFPRAELYAMYGQTECIRVCYLPPELAETHSASVGIAMPGTEAWIEDEGGNLLGPGESGELIVRGPHVMQGYWRDPEGTAERLRPGRWPWERVLATNDLFRLDEEGLLHFVARRDDIIKSRGEKVVPREVEEVLLSAPGVREAAVVGVPDRLLGEAVRANVAPEEGAELEPAALKRHCAERLEDHMVPKEVMVHDQLPRTPNGKVDRQALIRDAG